VAAAVVSIAGLAGAARLSGVQFSTFAKLPANDAPARTSSSAPAPMGRTAPQGVPLPSTADTPSAPPLSAAPLSAQSPPAAPAIPAMPAMPMIPMPAAAYAPPAPLRVPARKTALREPARRATLASAPVGVTSTPEQVAPLRAPPDAAALFGRASEARRLGDHARAAHFYRALIEDYPSSPEAHEASAVLGRMLLDDGDAEGALRCFDDYLRGGGVLREDVMLGRALSLRRLGRVGDETRALEDLVAAYPRSVHADRAKHRLADLGRP
jgi:TolA-binding protein